ncbi:MAG: hypothetical protein JJU20_11130 [Opitutales bacterium]|nr:hypothetical protein [Opitutales bacterium]
MTAYLQAFDCHTGLGSADETLQGLLAGRVALELQSVSAEPGGEQVPLALRQPTRKVTPPRWWADLLSLLASIPENDWGSARRPVIISSSNFGIDHLYQIGTGLGPGDRARNWATTHGIVAQLQRHFNWGDALHVVSHACVSAQIALCLASEWIETGSVEEVLIVSFDYVGPFVSCGFNSLKILNSGMPAPYRDQEVGSIGLGDGAAWATFSKRQAPWKLEATSLWNEMYQFTANDPSGEGFDAVLQPLSEILSQRKFWVKGHGTGTLEAGRLEAGAVARLFPDKPLVGWKGSLGHSLGSCALVELVLALNGHAEGRVPGTVGSSAPFFSEAVCADPVDVRSMDSVLLLCNAFGGAHGALLISHA